MSFFDFIAARSAGVFPKFLVRRLARRYVAGEAVSAAVDCARALLGTGLQVTIDVLGESAGSTDQVRSMEASYFQLMDALSDEGISADVSLKPTALGLLIDPALCELTALRISRHAKALGHTVCLDMEDSRCTQATIELFEQLRRMRMPVALALQAYLLRTGEDARSLSQGRHPLRICKGIYREPEELLVPGAARDRSLINPSFLEAVRSCFATGTFVSIATHDSGLVESILELATDLGVDSSSFEFQMLLGVCEPLRDKLRASGAIVRVYVPFGTDWYGYCVRRLQENPRLAGQVARAAIGLK
jgi:proline dehydrogenase